MERSRVDLHLPEGLRKIIFQLAMELIAVFRTFPICYSFLATLDLGRARVDSLNNGLSTVSSYLLFKHSRKVRNFLCYCVLFYIADRG